MGPRHAVGESDADAGNTDQLCSVDVDLVTDGEVGFGEAQLALPGEVGVGDEQPAGAAFGAVAADRPSVAADIDGFELR